LGRKKRKFNIGWEDSTSHNKGRFLAWGGDANANTLLQKGRATERKGPLEGSLESVVSVGGKKGLILGGGAMERGMVASEKKEKKISPTTLGEKCTEDSADTKEIYVVSERSGNKGG